MISDLRRADRSATFPFLNLLAELRNTIYTLLLTPVKQVDGFTYYHPPLLGCCKQVYDEAEGLLNITDHVEIWLRVHTRRLRLAQNL
jgi:hypothetical protein